MESVLLVAPITALEFVGDYLLSGEGPYLTVYSLKDTCRNSQKIRRDVLKGYAVHGIKLCNYAPSQCADALLCVFGSKGLIILQLISNDEDLSLSHVSDLRELHDWIWDVQWLKANGETTSYLGLALGHNSVALYDYGNGRVLKEIHCAEKCILYSAHFWGESWEELVLVSGTVFNQLVIWRPADKTNSEGRVEPKQRISGHDGVIFSIFYEKRRGFLASASDDRSLRIWDVGDLAVGSENVQCLRVLYGHQSRVWSVKLLPDYVVSIGEDSACIVWDYDGDIVHNFKGHKGRGIRAVAVNDHVGVIATGGADSGIRLWQITQGKSLPSNSLWTLNFCSSQCKGSPKAIAMVDTSCLVVMTDLGSIYTYDLINKEWSFVLGDEDYISYSLLDVCKSPSGALCAIGNISGSVKIFPLRSGHVCKNIKLYQGKVHSLSWVPHPFQGTDTYSLFTSGPDGLMVWVEVAYASGQITDAVEKGRFILPACKQRWHTCVAFLPEEDFIVVGDRRGSLMLFSTNFSSTHHNGDNLTQCTDSESACADTAEGSHSHSVPNSKHCAAAPVSSLFGVHGKLGVTSLSCRDGFVYSTGRDGLYRQLTVAGGRLIMLRKQKSCKGMEWIERLSFTTDGNLLVWGFHATNFVVWSTGTNEKVHCVPCGGGHRSWSYVEEEGSALFAYIKSGDVFIYQSRATERLHGVLKEPMHGREFTCVRYAGTLTASNNQSVHILITSSEDTTVNIFSFNETSKHVRHLATLNDHLSSVKTLALGAARHGDCGFSAVLFTAGGRAQIECYRVQLSQKSVEANPSCQVTHLTSHRLDEHWDRVKNKHRTVKVDPETRYMSVAAIAEESYASRRTGSPYVFLAAACSDGSVRFFVMCEISRRMMLAAESFYHQRCVLKVEKLVKKHSDQQRVLLCSAATDGRIAFWDIASTVNEVLKVLESDPEDFQPLDLGSPCFTVSAHQCGINSLHIHETKRGHHVMASGGDDNSIHVCHLSVAQTSGEADGSCIQLLQAFSATAAHAAHVTGLRILRDDLLASASVDQRLILWAIGDKNLQRLHTKFCHVPDVSELDCWMSDDGKGRLFAVCGQGLEVIHSTASSTRSITSHVKQSPSI